MSDTATLVGWYITETHTYVYLSAESPAMPARWAMPISPTFPGRTLAALLGFDGKAFLGSRVAFTEAGGYITHIEPQS